MLNKTEKDILEKMMNRHKIQVTENTKIDQWETQYFQQKNFITCVLMQDKEILTVGIAKRNPIDEFIGKIGTIRSLNAAFKNVLGLQ